MSSKGEKQIPYDLAIWLLGKKLYKQGNLSKIVYYSTIFNSILHNCKSGQTHSISIKRNKQFYIDFKIYIY